jgi:hypothetical protein
MKNGLSEQGCGGYLRPKPGEESLADNGSLFPDALPECNHNSMKGNFWFRATISGYFLCSPS